MYDLIVIGAGPGGYEAAAHAGRMGKRVALIEERHIGGTCLNVGCIPTKTLLRTSRLLNDCRHAAAYGLELGEVRFNMAKLMERKSRIVGTLARGVDAMLKRAGVEVLRGRGRLVSRGSVQVNGTTLQAANVLIASGSRPAVPPIPGIGGEGVIDSSGVLELRQAPGRLAVIGGGYIGLEFAGFFAAVGTQVTVLEMLPRIAAGMDADIAGRLAQALKKSGVDIRTSCRVTGIDGGTVHYETDGAGPASLSADLVLNATGRQPVIEDLGLEAAGVDADRRGVRASDRGKTSAPGVWACGDCTGRRLLAHAATREGIVAVNNMFDRPDRLRYEAIPSVIYTHPEVAAVGFTEEELTAQGLEFKKTQVPMALAGRFLVENEGASGVIKVLTGRRWGELLGVHAIGDMASEFIVMAAAMMEMEMRASDIEGIVFPHPTVGEALKSAILEAAHQE